MFFDHLSFSAVEALGNIVEDVFAGVNKALPVDQIEKHPVDISVIQGVLLLQRVFNAVGISL
jgi:hypothetical protein